MIYPLYGVYMPTSQQYVNLFSNYVSQTQEAISAKKNMVDLGCGSGILPIVLKVNGGFTGHLTALDANENALECTKMNAQLYGIIGAEALNTRNVDIVDMWYPASGTPDAVLKEKQVRFYNKIGADLGIPQGVELITCNPPWLPATHLGSSGSQNDMDNAIYDPKERFLMSCLNFAKFHLAEGTGEMLLIYSDLATNLGIQDPDRVRTLANAFGLTRVDLLDQTELSLSKN